MIGICSICSLPVKLPSLSLSLSPPSPFPVLYSSQLYFFCWLWPYQISICLLWITPTSFLVCGSIHHHFIKDDLLVTSQFVIASGWIEMALFWWPIALHMRLCFTAVLMIMLVYERWMEKMTGNADREGGYEREGFEIEMVYMLHPNHSSGGLLFP